MSDLDFGSVEAVNTNVNTDGKVKFVLEYIHCKDNDPFRFYGGMRADPDDPFKLVSKEETKTFGSRSEALGFLERKELLGDFGTIKKGEA
jgi:hypothetical protein